METNAPMQVCVVSSAALLVPATIVTSATCHIYPDIPGGPVLPSPP